MRFYQTNFMKIDWKRYDQLFSTNMAAIEIWFISTTKGWSEIARTSLYFACIQKINFDLYLFIKIVIKRAVHTCPHTTTTMTDNLWSQTLILTSCQMSQIRISIKDNEINSTRELKRKYIDRLLLTSFKATFNLCNKVGNYMYETQ